MYHLQDLVGLSYRSDLCQKKHHPPYAGSQCLLKQAGTGGPFIRSDRVADWIISNSSPSSERRSFRKPFQKLVHHTRAPQIISKAPTEATTAYDISSSKEQTSHLRQRVKMAKELHEFDTQLGPQATTELYTRNIQLAFLDLTYKIWL